MHSPDYLAVNFINVSLICYYHCQIFELCYIFKDLLGCFEHGGEHLCFIKGGEFLD